MGLYSLLRTISSGESSISVGKLLALRLATQTPKEDLIETSKKEEENSKNEDKFSKHEGFQSPYDQFMHLARGPDIEEVEERDIFFRDILDMLQTYGGYQIPAKLGYENLVSLLSLWSRIIDANSFAIEVPIMRRRRRCSTEEYSLCTKGQVTDSSSDDGSILLPPLLLDDERISQLRRCDRAVSAVAPKYRQIGTAVYGVSSYFNHSCDPNLTFIIAEKAKLMVTAKRCVKAGQELCISYGPTFRYHPKKVRMKYVSRLCSHN